MLTISKYKGIYLVGNIFGREGAPKNFAGCCSVFFSLIKENVFPKCLILDYTNIRLYL